MINVRSIFLFKSSNHLAYKNLVLDWRNSKLESLEDNYCLAQYAF